MSARPFTASPPSSPSKSKSKSSQIIRTIFTGIQQPVDTVTHKQRWSPHSTASALAPPVVDDAGAALKRSQGGGGRVANMIKGYEAVSLSNSRPYSLIPLPPSPTKSTPSPTMESPSTSVSSPSSSYHPSPTVPASFFQQQQPQSRRPLPSEKENSNALRKSTNGGLGNPLSRSVYSAPPPPERRQQLRVPSGPRPLPPSNSSSYLDSKCVESSDATSVSSSTITNSTSSASIAQVSQARVEVLQKAEPKRFTNASTPSPVPIEIPFQKPRPTSLQIPQPLPPKRTPSTHSYFSEDLPPSSPSEMLPFPGEKEAYKRLPMDAENEVAPPRPIEKDTNGRGRKRAMTLGSGEHRHHEVIERRETEEERERRIEGEFAKLLDSMQLPSRSVRVKMQGLTLSLKEEMLRSSQLASTTSLSASVGRPTHSRGQSLNILSSSTSRHPSSSNSSGSSSHKRSKSPGRFLKKSKSSQSLKGDEISELIVPKKKGGGGHGRSVSASSLFRSLGRSSGERMKEEVVSKEKKEDYVWWAVKLRSSLVRNLEVKEVGRLRGMLRSESPTWVEEFIRNGGYTGLLERLKELLDVEWREEQHDDQMLHEILRCFKALTLTASGKRALCSVPPTPFLPLTALLFSEKKPGDLPCRQVIVELLIAVYDLCPPQSAPIQKGDWKDATITFENNSSPVPSVDGDNGGVRRYTRQVKGGDDGQEDEVISKERKQKTHELMMSLMRGPPNEKEEAKHSFIQQTHKPRIYKTWMTEITGVCCDYFWIFCHNNNGFWSFELLNEEGIESPKVPSGMTGGVEYEAMEYCTTQFKLVNALAKHAPSVAAAFDFHNSLFNSGFERVLLTLRRASHSFYPTLHLEIARYLSLARGARFNPGARILSYMDERILRPEEREVLARQGGRWEGGRDGPCLEEMKFD